MLFLFAVHGVYYKYHFFIINVILNSQTLQPHSNLVKEGKLE